jgi:alpha-beta hydrolase superfamily lysophospholipase
VSDIVQDSSTADRGKIVRDEGAVTQRAVPGPALYFVSAAPAEAPRAVVGLLHGYADHAARYAHVMEAWAKAGIATVALDMRGHGRAAGTRGYCGRFEEYLDDATELARLVRDRARGAACFLMGHSFGGLVASLSAIEQPGPWRGLLLTGPYFGLAMDVPRAKLIGGKIASRLVPKLGIPMGLTGADVTHDPVRAKAYESDPLVFKNARARWFTEATKAQERALARAGELRMPLYVLFGGADHVAKPAAGKAFVERAGSTDKTWEELPGLYHEVLNEPEWEGIARKMSDWMLGRVA